MPPIYRIFEVCIYALLNFLPFMFLALYPFRKSLRFSPAATGILIFLLVIVQLWLGIWAAFFSNKNAAVNAILLYFSGLAHKLGIVYTVSASIPENIMVPANLRQMKECFMLLLYVLRTMLSMALL